MNHQEKGVSRRQMLDIAIGLSGLAATTGIRSVFGQEVKRQHEPDSLVVVWTEFRIGAEKLIRSLGG